MNSKKIIITVRYKSTGGAYINSYKARNGNIIFKEETETKTETKKFLKALRQNLGQDIDPITLLLPCEHKILKRYDLSRWTQPLSILRSPYQALYRFSTILSQTGQVESPSLLLLGTLLSGYTSEFFNQCVHAAKLPIRALTLDAPWKMELLLFIKKQFLYWLLIYTRIRNGYQLNIFTIACRKILSRQLIVNLPTN